MQFCGYSSFKWDLVGSCGLNTKTNEKKKNFNSLEGGSPVMWVVGLTENLTLWAVGLNSAIEDPHNFFPEKP